MLFFEVMVFNIIFLHHFVKYWCVLIFRLYFILNAGETMLLMSNDISNKSPTFYDKTHNNTILFAS